MDKKRRKVVLGSVAEKNDIFSTTGHFPFLNNAIELGKKPHFGVRPFIQVSLRSKIPIWGIFFIEKWAIFFQTHLAVHRRGGRVERGSVYGADDARLEPPRRADVAVWNLENR